MFNNTVIVTCIYYYPLGNTPAVCLTQDLPPEQNADILCLGCGDARNILFTCFADAARKMDVTCCDIEPGIHARNILLYSLLIDDRENGNIERIWNIYYHWKLDEESVDLLETQARKLVQMSKSTEMWHGSVYGSCVRFCDSRSLALVRAYWSGFQLRGLSSLEKERHLSRLQAAIDRAKMDRDKILGNNLDITSLRSASPVSVHVLKDMSEVLEQWWNHGTTLPSVKSTYLNSAFLYTSKEATTLHYGLSPLLGFPLSTAYVPIIKGSPFYLEGCPSAKRLVESVKIHFTQWASAFRKAVENKLMIRVFCGDALAFGYTLRNCLITGATSMNLFCDNWTNSPLILDSDYCNHGAPVSFDIVDTSNLADHLGPLNLIGIASTLLKYNTSSSLYTEMLVQREGSLSNRLLSFFGVDLRTMSMLFGLVLPELFTNAMDSIEDDLLFREVSKTMSDHQVTTQVRSRLRWKRLQGARNVPYLHIETKSLAKLLIQLHDSMFKHETEGLISMFGSTRLCPPSVLTKSHVYYNRSSFALCLSLLRTIVISDWDECVKYLYENCSSMKSVCMQDLHLNMHLLGVDNDTFRKPSCVDMRDAILAPFLPVNANEDGPEQLCVTVRVAKEKLKAFTKEIGTPAIVCKLKTRDSGKEDCLHVFSAAQIAFGAWHPQSEGDLYPYIVEDHSQFYGTSDMFVSIIVPTLLLLDSKCATPVAMVGVMSTGLDYVFEREFGYDFCFVHENITSENVFITRFMPGMPALPMFAQQKNLAPILATTTVHLTEDGSKVNTLTQRTTIECPATKVKLADKSSKVNVEFQSPLTASINIAQSEKINVKLPLPLSVSQPKIRIARKSAYVEIESPLFNPLKEDASKLIFPTIIADGSTTPTLWTSSRINLDTMPRIDLSNKEALSWFNIHTTLMFSNRERLARDSFKDPWCSGGQDDSRTDLKNGLFNMFMHFTGLQGEQADIFALSKTNGGIQTLIFPSCLRLDLVNHTVVFDAAIIPLTDAMFSDGKVTSFLQELTYGKICQIKVTEVENRAWKALFPTLVERCRTWKHNSNCEYVKTREVPLTKGINADGVWSFCVCGVGKFPLKDYLENQTKKLAGLSYMLRRYGTRAAIAPIFPVPYVEDCFLKGMINEKLQGCSAAPKCAKCGEGKPKLLLCSRCKIVKYCSTACQKLDYKEHKLFCNAA